MSEPALELLLESGVAVHPAVLSILAETLPKRNARKRVKPKPRRGIIHSIKPQERWRIPILDDVWSVIKDPKAGDPGSYAGKQFFSIYGVPKQIFDELVQEASQHRELAGKQAHGDGVHGNFSKPLELKVAACLEMCRLRRCSGIKPFSTCMILVMSLGILINSEINLVGE